MPNLKQSCHNIFELFLVFKQNLNLTSYYFLFRYVVQEAGYPQHLKNVS